MPNRLYIETWGCQMNRHDAERLAGALAVEAFHLVDELKQADVVLFLGCMVRQKAEEKVYVGDGRSDIRAVEAVNRVYAKGNLLEYCRENGIDAVPFRDFTDVLREEGLAPAFA